MYFFHNSLFYNIYLYILKDIMRGSIAPEPGDFGIFICLNAALLGPPKPVLQSLVSICCTLFFLHFFIFFGGGRYPPTKLPSGSSPLVQRLGSLQSYDLSKIKSFISRLVSKLFSSNRPFSSFLKQIFIDFKN